MQLAETVEAANRSLHDMLAALDAIEASQRSGGGVPAGIRAMDPARALRATLRTAVLDEVGWPRLDELAHSMGELDDVLTRWPWVLLRKGPRTVIVGPPGVLLDRRDLIEADALLQDFRVAGTEALIAFCRPADAHCGTVRVQDVRAVWSHRPHKEMGFRDVCYLAPCFCGFLTEDGATVMGRGRQRPGGRAGRLRQLWTDGRHAWAADLDTLQPLGGNDEPQPAMVERIRAYGRPALDRSWLTWSPTPGLFHGAEGGLIGAVLAEVGGQWETITPDGSRLVGAAMARLDWPGHAEALEVRGRGLSRHGTLVGGGVTALRWSAPIREGLTAPWRSVIWAEGTPCMLPWTFANCLEPRCPEGSAALRRVDVHTVEALLSTEIAPLDAVGRHLPEVDHPALRRGLASLVDETRRARARLRGMIGRLGPLRVVSELAIDPERIHRLLGRRLAPPADHARIGSRCSAREGLSRAQAFAGIAVDRLYAARDALLWLTRSPVWSEDERVELRALLDAVLDRTAPDVAVWLMARAAESWSLLPEHIERLARQTGLTRDESLLILTGLARHDPPPGPGMSAAVVRWFHPGPLGEGYGPAPQALALGLGSARAKAAHDSLSWVDEATLVQVWAAAGAPPTMEAGCTLEDDIDRMAAAWNERVGRRPALPAAWVVRARKSLRASRAAWHMALLAGGEVRAGPHIESVGGAVRAALWAAAHLPSEHPFCRGIPDALRRLRGEVPSWPSVSVPFRTDRLSAAASAAFAEELAVSIGTVVLPSNAPSTHTTTVRHDGPGSLPVAWLGSDVLEDPGRLDALLQRMIIRRFSLARSNVRALRWLVSDEMTSFVDHPPSAWSAHPRVSAPEAVDRVRHGLQLDEPPAILWMMAHLMHEPTDGWVDQLTGWSPSERKQHVATLVSRGLLVAEKRPRSRRRWFLPGEWAELAAPTAPQERVRVELLQMHFPDGERRPPLWRTPLATQPLGLQYRQLASRL